MPCPEWRFRNRRPIRTGRARPDSGLNPSSAPITPGTLAPRRLPSPCPGHVRRMDPAPVSAIEFPLRESSRQRPTRQHHLTCGEYPKRYGDSRALDQKVGGGPQRCFPQFSSANSAESYCVIPIRPGGPGRVEPWLRRPRPFPLAAFARSLHGVVALHQQSQSVLGLFGTDRGRESVLPD